MTTPRFTPRKTKKLAAAEIAEARAPVAGSLTSPAMEVPERVVKKLIAAKMPESMRASFQSNGPGWVLSSETPLRDYGGDSASVGSSATLLFLFPQRENVISKYQSP